MTSYAAGFTRRGLSGTVINSVSTISRLSTPQLFLLINLALYAFIGLRIALTYGRAPASNILFLFFPTSLAFLIWDAAIIGRKDTLLIAFAFMTSLLARHGGERGGSLHFWFALSLALAVLVLIHDSFVFFIPLLVVVTCAGSAAVPKSLAVLKRVFAASSLPGLVFLMLIAFRQPLDLDLLFDALGSDGANLRAACRASQVASGRDAWMGGGSICYLNTPLSVSLRHVWQDLAPILIARSMVTGGVLLAITTGYFVILTTDAAARGRIALLIVLGLLATLPLYAIAIDWGRWLYMTTMIFAANLPPRDGASRIGGISVWSFCAAIAALSLTTVSHTRSPMFTMRGLEVVTKAADIARRPYSTLNQR
ncbi:MAG: hypothetical protein EKK41_05620 [Hyphomicrobiales bacterium]|nr:MAG: hypothetical protein EKK41_05620 [Hyphomicrobiales bacterium]